MNLNNVANMQTAAYQRKWRLRNLIRYPRSHQHRGVYGVVGAAESVVALISAKFRL